jgi:hypothetical protein
MNYYNQRIKWAIFYSCFAFIIACGKEEIAMDFTTSTIPEFIKKSLMHGNKNTVKYSGTSLGNISMDIEEGFFKSPTFNTKKPVDYTEKYAWKMTYSTPSLYDYLTVRVDTVFGNSTRIAFLVYFSNEPIDSTYTYFHYPLPGDSVYQSNLHKFHKVYRLGSKDYYNCYELVGGSSKDFIPNNKNKLIFNTKDGIIYFEAAYGEKITINP